MTPAIVCSPSSTRSAARRPRPAELLARFHRLRGEDVLFATGTDEDAPKNAKAAAEAGKPPQEFVDAMAGRFRATWDRLGISYDVFIRTTEARHARAAQHLFRVL